MKFAKGEEENFSTEIFQITNFIQSRPRPVYDLQYLNKTSIEKQFYVEELNPFRISKQTAYKIDKIL